MRSTRREARLAIAASIAAGALAAPAASNAQEHPELRYDLRVDIPVSAGVLGLLVASQVLQSSLAPASCRWCDRNADGTEDLNALDRSARESLRWSDAGTATVASNVTGFGLSAISAFGLDAVAAGHDGRIDEAPADLLVIFEAAVVAAGVNQLTKDLVGRERPFVHMLPPEQKPRTRSPSDNNVSFYSGHTSLAFSLAVASGTVASMRDYRLAPLVWATGLTFATSTGYLRVAADRHYLTDVLAGAVIGSAIGFAMPFLFHRPESVAAAPASGPSAGGTSIAFAGRF